MAKKPTSPIAYEDARNLQRVRKALDRLFESAAKTSGEDLALTAGALEWLVDLSNAPIATPTKSA